MSGGYFDSNHGFLTGFEKGLVNNRKPGSNLGYDEGYQ